MSHQHGVRPGRLREGSALTPRQSRPGTLQGSDGRLELPLSSPPYRPLDALSGDRRGLSRVLGWYTFPRAEVPHSVRGSSNQVLKRTAAGAGGSSGRWSRGRLTLIV
jgi:hypothetical protein